MARMNSDKQSKADKPWLFQKGQSGNPDGRPKGRTITEELKKLLTEMRDDNGKDGFEQIAELIIDKVKTDSSLLRDLVDRIDGKPIQPQEIDVTGSGQLVIVRHGNKPPSESG